MPSLLQLKSRLVVVLAGIVLTSMLAGSQIVRAADKAESNDKTKELLKKRLATITEIHDLLLKGFKDGKVSAERVRGARTLMLRAKLDLSETKEERIKIHEALVKTAEEALQQVKKSAEEAQVDKIEVLKAELQVVDARIGLERARASR